MREIYEVEVKRAEVITFELAAESAYDAEDRYLTDGEETGSYLAASGVTSVRKVRSET